MLRATYVGTELPPECRGQTALVRTGHRCGLMKARSLLVQFDDRSLGLYAHGWWDVDPLDLVLVRGEHADLTDDPVLLARVRVALWRRRFPAMRRMAQALVDGARGTGQDHPSKLERN